MYTFDDLVHTIDEFRSEHGCPWDKKQTHESLRICLANENQEVYDATDNQNVENLCKELGDILPRVMLHSRIVKEEGAFTIDDVASGVCRKTIHRHPHIFGDVKVNSVEEGLALWSTIKKQEKAERP